MSKKSLRAKFVWEKLDKPGAKRHTNFLLSVVQELHFPLYNNIPCDGVVSPLTALVSGAACVEDGLAAPGTSGRTAVTVPELDTWTGMRACRMANSHCLAYSLPRPDWMRLLFTPATDLPVESSPKKSKAIRNEIGLKNNHK